MTIVAVNLNALQDGALVPLTPTDILRITVNFDYKVAEETTVVLWAALGTGLIRSPMEAFKSITLEKAVAYKNIEEIIDINIPEKGEKNGVYWLHVEIKDYDVSDHIDDAVEISGMPEDIWDVVAPVMSLMLMMMVFNMVQPTMQPTE